MAPGALTVNPKVPGSNLIKKASKEDEVVSVLCLLQRYEFKSYRVLETNVNEKEKRPRVAHLFLKK